MAAVYLVAVTSGWANFHHLNNKRLYLLLSACTKEEPNYVKTRKEAKCRT
jgi:hypothetical protein